MNNLICIVGPTATGKTKLAEEINKVVNGKSRSLQIKNDKSFLISVDSRQVYIGMDIGTGKDAKIFGTDLVKPEKLFNVSGFVKIIRPKIEELWKKNILPVLVGGAGLYLKAVIDGIETMDVPPDNNLRQRLLKLNLADLQEELKIKNYELGIKEKNCGMNNSDWNNKRRLIRRIEIMKRKFDLQEKPIVPLLDCSIAKRLNYDNLLLIGLTAPIEQLKKKIEKRVQSRLDEGLLFEMEGLVKEYGWSEVLRNTIAYREWEDYFSGKISKEEAISKWMHDEIDYAKRQMTWFKKDKRIKWLESTDVNLLQKTVKLININLQ